MAESLLDNTRRVDAAASTFKPTNRPAPQGPRPQGTWGSPVSTGEPDPKPPGTLESPVSKGGPDPRPGNIRGGTDSVEGYLEPLVRPFDNASAINEDRINIGGPQMDASTSVESRIGSILDKNSELMQRAGTFGRMQAGQTGAGASSMASRAAQSAIMDFALPIAQADASTASRFKELGFDYESTLGKMNEQQRLEFEKMDKQHSFSQEILKNTQDFQRWAQERGWSEDLQSNMMKMYTTLAQQGMAGMANMAASQQVTPQEGTDFTAAWKDAIKSLTAISGLDLSFD